MIVQPCPQRAGLPALVALVALACGEGPRNEPRVIAQERQWLPIGRPALPDVPPAQRFGFDQRRPAAPATGSGLTWSTPPDWRELPPSSLRLANFRVAGDPRAECYLTVLSGDGGGVLSNVNRWRGQMSLPEIGPGELARASRAPLFGAEAVLVDLEGTWVGMGGDESGEDYRMVGLIGVEQGNARFLKMTGPADVIGPEVDAFLALAASFHDAGAHDGHDHDHDHDDPHAGMDLGAATAPAAGGSSLSWTAPPTWRRAEDRPMREVTFLLGPEEEGECYVALLGGTGGGAFANVNRWRGQMGQPDLSPGEFDVLQRISMLGAEGIVVEVDGTYRGMGDAFVEHAALLGAVCELPGQAVFVKLIGPRDVVRGAREEFLAFCGSLERGG